MMHKAQKMKIMAVTDLVTVLCLSVTHCLWHSSSISSCSCWHQSNSLTSLSGLAYAAFCISLVPLRQTPQVIKVFYSPTNAQVIVLKTVLKFTLKQLRHVSVQSHPVQGAHYSCLLKLHIVKIVNYGTLVVMWLHILVGL